MTGDTKIELMTLWQRESAKGTPYLSGFLGSARVVAFIDNTAELREGVTAIWRVYIQPGNRKGEAKPKAETRRPATPTNADRTDAPNTFHNDEIAF